MNLDSAIETVTNMLRDLSEGKDSDEELREQATELVVRFSSIVLASTALVSSMAENTTHFAAVAKLVHNQYVALKKEGFSQAEALRLCEGIVSGLTVPSK